METKLESSVLEIKDVECRQYSWDFRIPPKSKINTNMSKLMGGCGFVFNNLRFTSGFLANVPHQLSFEIFRNQVNMFLMLPPRDRKRYSVRDPGRLVLMWGNTQRHTKDLRFSYEDKTMETIAHIQYASKWSNDGSWDDNVNLMRIEFTVECHEAGEVILFPDGEILKKLHLGEPPLIMNASNLFLSQELSDVTFVCDNEEFPAHRFLLACKSPVFRRMFQHNMKENKERKIIIEDMSPKALRELLRFLYSGNAQDLKTLCTELFVASEKYDLKYLKNNCEKILYENLSVENALEMYDLAETYNGNALKEKALQVMKKNKVRVIHDAETFRSFTTRYPELMFQLFNA